MKFLSRVFHLLLISFLLVSCVLQGSKSSVFIASHFFADFEKKLVQSGDFIITTYQKITDPDADYVFYIEGDGYIAGRYGLSANPTPRSDSLLRLVAQDKRPNVVYIARLCQYTPMHLNSKCSPKYWSDSRLSLETVNVLSGVIDQVNNGRPFSVIGYSGGGGIAVLIAAQHSSVKDIITIAGNLDIDAFTRHHHSPTMFNSLNPIDYVNKVRHIPQIHLSGGLDHVVPGFITEHYVRIADSPCVSMQRLDGAGHSDGWEGFWLEFDKKPTCLSI